MLLEGFCFGQKHFGGPSVVYLRGCVCVGGVGVASVRVAGCGFNTE